MSISSIKGTLAIAFFASSILSSISLRSFSDLHLSNFFSSLANSSMCGVCNAICRPIALRIERTIFMLTGLPTVVYPARFGLNILVSLRVVLIKSGNAKSSKKKSRNSSLVRTKVNSSSVTPSGEPSRPAPLPPLGLGMASPTILSLFPDRTYLRSLPDRWCIRGSAIPSIGTFTSLFSSSSFMSAIFFSFIAFLTASLTCVFTRFINFCLIPELFLAPLFRRSMTVADMILLL